MRAVQGAVLTAGLAGLASAHVKGKRGTIVPDGTIWTACTTPGVVALTFDDGPYIYTQEIVDQLTAAGQRATFFQNGMFSALPATFLIVRPKLGLYLQLQLHPAVHDCWWPSDRFPHLGPR
jgi:hypothetical protein